MVGFSIGFFCRPPDSDRFYALMYKYHMLSLAQMYWLLTYIVHWSLGENPIPRRLAKIATNTFVRL